MLTKFVAGACAAGFAMAALPAAAHDYETQLMSVEHADLNLATEDGATVMLNRLEHAAFRVCSDNDGRRGAGQMRQLRSCKNDALDAAVAQLDAPLVTALHEGETVQQRFAQTRRIDTSR